MKNLKTRIDILFLQCSLLIASPFLASQANASAITKLTGFFTQWKTELYLLLGVIAFFYVIWGVIKVFMDEAQWGDVIKRLLGVAGAGAILVMVEFAWSALK